ncbi:chitinase [Holotrichia oblita]|uniref:Chitinase n=1 Tax=Holotrichia oblita TaxID=644536 RepID=A0ACB9TNC5_HOLOL|nr:chitinase [Holotrichia oblita]
METYGFDGFDLDWEYPAQRGGAATDKVRKTEHTFRYLDQIHVMTYDLHGAWDGVTGHNAPLYPSSKDVTDAARQLNVDACIQGWIKRGADPKKIIMGVGTYGRSFTLADANKIGIGATSNNGGTAGRCTREASILGYNEICENIGKGGWTVVWDGEQQVPYAYKGNQWVGYDNAQSIALKTEYAKFYGLGGIMVWSVETDDFNGYCGERDILLKTIRNTLALPVVELIPPTTGGGDNSGGNNGGTTGGTTGGENGGTTGGNNGGTTGGDNSGSTGGTPNGVCTAAGYARDPETCTVFYQCVAHQGSYVVYPFNCPAGLYFDLSSNVCNWPALVPECKK